MENVVSLSLTASVLGVSAGIGRSYMMSSLPPYELGFFLYFT